MVFAPIVEDGTSMTFFSFFLIGKISNAALGRSTTQSSTLENNATLAMDGRLDTCSITEYTIYNNNTIYDSKIWSVDLKPNVFVKGLSITNNMFVELNQHFKVVLEGICSILLYWVALNRIHSHIDLLF